MLGYALAFLLLASSAAVLGSSRLAEASANVAWIVLVAFFVLTLFAALGRAMNGISNL